MAIYHRIWKKHYGPIPKDSEGRSYEIHHIDGDRNNNTIENLMCVSIEEHYNIHNDQGDYGACLAIMRRRKTSPEAHAAMSRELALQRSRAGTNPFLGLAKRMVKEGTHHWLSQKHSQTVRKRQLERIAQGTHEFSIEVTCPHCNRTGQKTVMARWHFDKCKFAPGYVKPAPRKYKKRKGKIDPPSHV